MPEGNDEITEMLLRNERSNKAGIVIPGDDSDAVSEHPVYDDAALLAASFTNAEKEEGDMVLEEMKIDSDENDYIHDVAPDVIAKMSLEELDRYNKLYQDIQRHL